MKYKYDDTDCSLEDDLQYPPEIHCLHKDYPMALAIMTINEDMLSNVYKIFINITTTRKQEARQLKQNAPERFQRRTNSPTYRHRRIITENLVGVAKDCQTIKLSKPLYTGMTVLDCSKTSRYSFTVMF